VSIASTTAHSEIIMADKTNGTTATTNGAQTGTLTKSEAVRRAMKALGMDAGRSEIRAYVHDKFGIDVNLDHISSLSSDIRRLAKNKKKPAKKEKLVTPAPVVQDTPAKAPVKRVENTSAGLSLEDLHTVKGLIQRLGATQLKEVIDLLTS